MMAEVRPLLIFDTTAILAGKTLQWQEWERFGQCILPQAAFKEMESLTKISSDPQEESIAREFIRYWPTSDFQSSDANALVGIANPEAQGLSKRVRLEQAIAECAYALAKQQLGTLVVLVSHDRPLVQRILSLQIENLTAISVAELLGWVRQQQRPKSVTQSLKRMPGPPIPASPLRQGSALDLTAAPISEQAAALAGNKLETSSRLSQPPQRSLRPPKPKPSLGATLKRIQNTLALLISFTLLGGSGLLAWRIADPASSALVWDVLGLPDIPGLSSPPVTAPPAQP
jgi:hypothetical protein